MELIISERKDCNLHSQKREEEDDNDDNEEEEDYDYDGRELNEIYMKIVRTTKIHNIPAALPLLDPVDAYVSMFGLATAAATNANTVITPWLGLV